LTGVKVSVTFSGSAKTSPLGQTTSSKVTPAAVTVPRSTVELSARVSVACREKALP
jgi:hypothetical protein